MKNMHISFRIHSDTAPMVIICLMSFLFAAGAVRASTAAENGDQPYRLDVNGRKVAIYLPEVDSMKGETIAARSAFSVTESGNKPVFGAMRYTARAVTDKKKSTVKLSQIRVEDVKLPQNGDSTRLKTELSKALEGAEWVMSSDRFEMRLTPGVGNKKGNTFDTHPPKIYYEEQPAVLVFIDGTPVLKEADGGYYKHVVNTAYFIVLNPDDNYFYLKGGKWWYRTTDLKKAWTQIDAPPKAIRQLADSAFAKDAEVEDSSISDLKTAPKIIVSTEPAEIVVVGGAPDFVSIEGTNLLYVDNTESNVLMDVSTQKYYVLLEGRWYTAPSLSKGPWTFIPPDKLPSDFAKIPSDSNTSDVRASIAGTDEASDAALEAAVPEIAEIDRNAVTASIAYDGTPKFQLIAGTKVRYATNSDSVVLEIGGRYFAVDDGIWFESALPQGPWIVAAVVPPEVQDIPPSAPVYHVRYVYVYDYTPTVVYVGYTPGYYCSYVYDGTIVYGTGYYYRPWLGAVYYPHPITFAFGAHYNPYTGLWGYPVGVSYGWISFGWFASPFGFWGPAGYLYGYRHGYYHSSAHGYYHGYRNGYRNGYTAGRAAGYRATASGRPVYAAAYEKRGPAVRPVSGIRRNSIASADVKNVRRPSGAAWQAAGRPHAGSVNGTMRSATPSAKQPQWRHGDNTSKIQGNLHPSGFSQKTNPSVKANPSVKTNSSIHLKTVDKGTVPKSQSAVQVPRQSLPIKASEVRSSKTRKTQNTDENRDRQKNAPSQFGKEKSSPPVFHFNRTNERPIHKAPSPSYSGPKSPPSHSKTHRKSH